MAVGKIKNSGLTVIENTTGNTVTIPQNARGFSVEYFASNFSGSYTFGGTIFIMRPASSYTPIDFKQNTIGGTLYRIYGRFYSNGKLEMYYSTLGGTNTPVEKVRVTVLS